MPPRCSTPRPAHRRATSSCPTVKTLVDDDDYDRLLANRVGHLREWGYEAAPPPRETTWFDDVADFAGDVGEGLGTAFEGTVETLGDLNPGRLLTEPGAYGYTLARYAGGVGQLVDGLAHDPLGTLDQTFAGGNIGKGEYGRATGEILGGIIGGKGLNKLASLHDADRLAPDGGPRPDTAPAPRGPHSPDGAALVDEARAAGVKIDPDAVVQIGRNADGKIIWLERGNSRAGLEHIVQDHHADFLADGVPADRIPELVHRAATEGRYTGYVQGSAERGRPIYEVEFDGQTKYVAVQVGDNGFIVGANPRGSDPFNRATPVPETPGG